MSIWVAAGIALLAVMLGVLLGVSLTKPIMSLVAYVRRIGAGDLNGRLSLRQSPELRELSQEINTMTAGLQDRMRIRHSLAMAMEVQQNLLPRMTPDVSGLDLAGHSTYCDETGGDYYDFIDAVDLSETAATIAIGDVSGHGIASAMVMAEARGVLRSRCRQPGTLAELLTHMNDLLVADLGDGKFMTMLLVTLDSASRRMQWASAGHDMPFVYDPAGDRFIDIDGAGLPLGMMPDQTYEEYTLPDLPPGAVVLVATDGVWEMANIDGELFEKERVRQILRRYASLTADEISKCLQQELTDFLGQANQRDDITFVIAKMA
ncbi:MAG: HAMP domain-containing protein [Planctomycetaceae bacterium]|nr:MAG: HAMP domain-containing protein [Planctomycetaceae bacterium]